MDFKQKLIDLEKNFLKEFTKVDLYELDAEKFEEKVNKYIKVMANQTISDYAKPYLEDIIYSDRKNIWMLDKVKEIKTTYHYLGLNFNINMLGNISYSNNNGWNSSVYSRLYIRMDDALLYIKIQDISFNKQFTKEYNDFQKRIKKKAKDLISNFSNNKKLLDAVKHIILDGKE
jgi:hypothetical protein